MRRITRYTSLLIVMAILLAAISACAAPAVAPSGAAEPAAGEEAAPAAGEVNFEFWHIQTSTPEILQNSVDRFMADNPGVNVEVVPLQNDPYKTKIKVAVGAGNPPCVFPTWGGGPLYEYVQADHVVDLTDFMQQDSYVDRFVPAPLSNVTFDGKIWGVPVENSAIAVVWYNKTIFEELGLEPPTTWDELLAIVDTLNENDIAPFAMANKTKWPSSMFFMYLVDRLAGPEVFANAATRSGGTFEDPAFVEAGQMIQDLVNRGGFVEGFNGLDIDTGQSRQLLYAGKAAMELMGSWNLSTMRAENPEWVEANLDFFPFPAVEGGEGDLHVVGTIDNFTASPPSARIPKKPSR